MPAKGVLADREESALRENLSIDPVFFLDYKFINGLTL